MRCQEAKTMLYAYLDRSLSDEVERALFVHLSHCQYCRQELNYARQTHSLLEKCCTMVEPPQSFAADVIAAINQREEQKVADKKVAYGKFGNDSKGFTWNIKRLGQVASVALLSASVWWASQFGAGFQLARTPEPGHLPGNEIGIDIDPNGSKPNGGFDVALGEQTGKTPGVQPPKVDPPDVTLPGEPITEEPITNESGEQGLDSSPPVPLETGDKDIHGEDKNQPVTDTSKNPVIPDPVPTPAIQEPSGLIVAAGAKPNEVAGSVLLKRVDLGELAGSYNFVFAGAGGVSPQGSDIAYGKEGKIYLTSENSNEEKTIAEPGGTIQGLAWTQDGKRLAASVIGNRGQHGIWEGNVTGEWQLLVEIGGGKEVKWSPDGKKLAFTDNRGMAYVLTFNEGTKDRLYPITPEPGDQGASELVWSANSDALLMKWASTNEDLDTWMATLPKS